MNLIRKINIGSEYKDGYCIVVGNPINKREPDGYKVLHILPSEDEYGTPKFDVWIKKGNVVQLWKDFYKSQVSSKEYFIIDK